MSARISVSCGVAAAVELAAVDVAASCAQTVELAVKQVVMMSKNLERWQSIKSCPSELHVVDRHRASF